MTSAPEAHKTAGVVVADLLALGREIENTHGEEARKLLDAAAAALSTPSVPAVAELWGDGLAQSAASGAAAGWMPMESAPKDGKEVILRIPARGWPDHYQQIAHWADDMSGEEQPPFRGWFRNTGYGYAEVADPTGWRPLTASPAGDDPKALDAAARSSSTEAAEQEVERLREALRPFALIASGNEWDSVPDSHVLDLTYSSEAGGQETVAELSFSFFRQALAALAPSLPGKEEGQ